MKFLAIETSTHLCSVAVFENQTCISHLDVIDEKYTHAEKLHISINECLSNAAISPKDLDFICSGKGPGSYTGLRIGVSACKGLAYALDIPIVALSSLQILLASAMHELYKNGISTEGSSDLFIPMIDARRMEVFTTVYDASQKQIADIEAKIIDSSSFTELKNKFYFFGDGASKCAEVLAQNENAVYLPDIRPSVQFVGDLSMQLYLNQKFEDTAYFEPYYLKDFIAGKPKSQLT